MLQLDSDDAAQVEIGANKLLPAADELKTRELLANMDIDRIANVYADVQKEFIDAAAFCDLNTIKRMSEDVGFRAIPTQDPAMSRTVLRLDDLLREECPPDLIKIDVEGAAAAVLRGAARILDERGPSVYVELHGPEEQAGIRDELLSRGYVAYSSTGEVVADPVNRWVSPLWCVKRPAVGVGSGPGIAQQ